MKYGRYIAAAILIVTMAGTAIAGAPRVMYRDYSDGRTPDGKQLPVRLHTGILLDDRYSTDMMALYIRAAEAYRAKRNGSPLVVVKVKSDGVNDLGYIVDSAEGAREAAAKKLPLTSLGMSGKSAMQAFNVTRESCTMALMAQYSATDGGGSQTVYAVTARKSESACTANLIRTESRAMAKFMSDYIKNASKK